jgi:hypothetical protein
MHLPKWPFWKNATLAHTRQKFLRGFARLADIRQMPFLKFAQVLSKSGKCAQEGIA